MADNLGVQFFKDAKAQYESASKWRWVVAALLAYLHLGLVAPYADGAREKAAVDRQLRDDRASEEALKPVLDEATALANRVNEAKDRAASGLKKDLVERFQGLSRAVNALASLTPAEAEGAKGAAVFEPPTQPQIQQQQIQVQQPMTQADPSALAPMGTDLRRRIAETARDLGRDALPQELRAYIDREAIAPAFARANDSWAASGAAVARDGAAAIEADIARARAAAPTAAQALDRLAGSVNALRDEAQRLAFAPPANAAWWRTVPSKEATILSMTSGLASKVGDFSASETALDALTKQIHALVAKNHEAAVALDTRLADLDKRAAELQAQLGEIGAPLKVVAFKLSEFAPLLPLILAAALAAIAVWTADGLRRMTLAAELVDDEADRAAVSEWLHAMAGGSRGRIALVELAVAVASIAWTLAAARDVEALPPPVLTQPMLVAIAVGIVVAARAYRWRGADRAASA